MQFFYLDCDERAWWGWCRRVWRGSKVQTQPLAFPSLPWRGISLWGGSSCRLEAFCISDFFLEQISSCSNQHICEPPAFLSRKQSWSQPCQTWTGVEIWMWFFWGRNRHVVLNEASFSSGTSRKPCQPWICIYSTCSPPISRSNCGRTRAKWRRLPA